MPAAPDPMTKLLHHRVATDGSLPSVTPLYQNSAFEAGSPWFYTRKDNPNSAELEQCCALIEGCRRCIATTTGMAALQLALSLLRPGQHLVVNALIYGCSYQLFHRACERLDARLTILDLGSSEGIAAIPDDVDLVLFETPTNPFLRTVPIRAVVDATKARNPNALVVVDNTWATGLHQQPLRHGADIAVASATKFLSGHSDVMGGILSVDDPELERRLVEERFYAGAILDPHSCWLLRRSLQTFELRMREHVRVTALMQAFLATRDEIATVYAPEVDGEQLLAYGGILFVQLAPGLADGYARFAQALSLFGTGTGMACVTSMVAQPSSGSHASMSEADKATMGIDRGLVRLCFGLERPEDLIADLDRAFATLTAEAGVGTPA